MLDGVLEVLAGGRGGALGVARDARGEDRAVLGVEPGGREVLCGAVDVQVGARGVAQRGDHRRPAAGGRECS